MEHDHLQQTQACGGEQHAKWHQGDAEVQPRHGEGGPYQNLQ